MFFKKLVGVTCCLWSLQAGVHAGPMQETATTTDLPYRISESTTRFIGPLTEAGRVDFTEAMNQRLATGVTPENNAARFIFGTIPDGYDYWSPEEIELLRKQIDAESLPDGYPKLVHVKDFITAHDCPELEEEIAEASRLPRNAEENPMIAAFVEVNRLPLDQIVQATRLKKFNFPFGLMKIADPEFLPEAMAETTLSANLKHIGEVRDMARTIIMRAMLRVGKGDYQNAWSDIVAVRRLGRLIGSQGTLIEGLVGIAITHMACEAARNLIVHAMASGTTMENPGWSKMAAEWGQEFHTADIQSQFDFGERTVFVQLVTLVAENRIGIHDVMQAGGAGNSGVIHDALVDSLTKTIRHLNENGAIDWNTGLRWGNSYYDRIVTIARIENAIQRDAASKELEQEIERLEAYLLPAGVLSMAVDATSAGDRGKIVCGIVLSIVTPATQQVLDAEGRMQSYEKVVALTLASLNFHQQHKVFPADLKQLAEQFDSGDILIDSVNGTAFALTNDKKTFQIEYASRISNTLDFGISISKKPTN